MPCFFPCAYTLTHKHPFYVELALYMISFAKTRTLLKFQSNDSHFQFIYKWMFFYMLRAIQHYMYNFFHFVLDPTVYSHFDGNIHYYTHIWFVCLFWKRTTKWFVTITNVIQRFYKPNGWTNSKRCTYYTKFVVSKFSIWVHLIYFQNVMCVCLFK